MKNRLCAVTGGLSFVLLGCALGVSAADSRVGVAANFVTVLAALPERIGYGVAGH